MPSVLELKNEILTRLGCTEDLSFDETIDRALQECEKSILSFSPRWQKLLEKALIFSDYISLENKIRLAFILDDTSESKKLLKRNENEIRAFLKKSVLINYDLISKEQEALLLEKTGRKFFKVCISNKEIADYFYKYFKDDIFYPDIPELNYIISKDNIFNFISEELLVSLVFDRSNLNYRFIKERFILCSSDYILGAFYINYFDVLCYLYLSEMKNNFDIIIKEELSYRSSLQGVLGEFDRIGKEYFQTLKYLANIDKKERKNNPLYKKAYNLFLKELLKDFKDELDSNEYVLIERIFERIINGTSLFLALKINNKKSLYHFYKTNIFIAEDYFVNSLEEIKNYNAKQYLKLLSAANIFPIYPNVFDVNIRTVQLLSLFINFGFDVLYKIKDNLSSFISILYGEIDKIKEDSLYKQNLLDLIPFFASLSEYKKAFDIFKEAYAKREVNNKNYITSEYIKKVLNNPAMFFLPNNNHLMSCLERLNLIKKGDLLNEKYQALALYNRYKKRRFTSIPDIEGIIDGINFFMVDLHDEEILINGIDAYVLPKGVNVSCLTPGGKAATSLKHGAINPNGRFFRVIKNGKLLAYSWVWRAGEVICFDNIEVTKNLFSIPNYEELLYQIYYDTARELVRITKENEEQGVKLVVIGRTDKDVRLLPIDKLDDTTIYGFNPFSPNNSEGLYLEDSKERQLVIYKESLPENTDDVEPVYERKRNDVLYFKEINEDILSKLKSIYFDYCLEHCEKFEKHFDYIEGYIGEDWFLGINSNGSQEFYYYGHDERLFQEAKMCGWNNSAPSIITSRKEEVLKIIEARVEADDKVFNYLENLSEIFSFPPEFYFHSVSYSSSNDYKAVMSILKDQKIGSKYSRGIGSEKDSSTFNGYYYISVTKNNENLFYDLKNGTSFVISPDIMAFKTGEGLWSSVSLDAMYPYPRKGIDGEYHVFGSIPANKFLALRLNIKQSREKLLQVGKIVSLMDLYEMHIPLLTTEEKFIDPEYIRKLIRLK